MANTSESEEFCKGQSNPDDFFSFLMPNSPIKIGSLIVSAIIIVITPVLLSSIIWFEKYGPDNRRTFLNRLYKSIWMVEMEIIFVLQLTEIFRFVYGPMPRFYCFLKTVARTSYTFQLLLYLDAIAIARYLLIFCLKNPTAFQDEFWNMFLGIWIRLAGWLLSIVWSFPTDRQLINYYVCSGEDPTKDFKKPLEYNRIVEILTLIIHIIVYFRIKVYKINNSDISHPAGNSLIGNKFLSDITAQSLESFSKNAINVGVLVMTVISASYLSQLEPEKICLYKNFLYLHYLVSISASVLIVILVEFINHKPFHKFLWEHFKNLRQERRRH